MKHLYKLAFIMVFGAGFCVAQTGTMGQNPASTPPTFPSGQQQPAQTNNPDQTSPMGQTGTTSTTAMTKAQSDIQTALRKQLPASADAVTVGVSDDNKIELRGTVSSDMEKQQIEQIARAAAPDQTIVNKVKVSGSTATPPASSGAGLPNTAPDAGQQPPTEKTPPPDQPGTSKAPQQARPPMSMGFVQSQQGTEDKNKNQSGTTGQNSDAQKPSSAPDANNPSNSTSAAGVSDAQNNIQKAWQQDPTLSSANLSVSAMGEKLELTGTVANKDQKKAAHRIAESNASGFKIVDHIKVQGGNTDQSTPPAPPK